MSRIPLTVVGGYLGAGKTSWINRLLARPDAGRLAVLVNDFGEIAIDAALIVRHDGQTLTLANGCVCCAIGGDLTGAVRRAASAAPDHVVVEASGVADPLRIGHQARGLGEVSVAAVVTLLNPADAEHRAGDRYVGATVRRQLAGADLLAPTHLDRLGIDGSPNGSSGRLPARLIDWLARVAPGTPVADDEPDGALHAWLARHLLGPSARAPASPSARTSASEPAPERAPGEPHGTRFRSFVWQPDARVARAPFEAVLREACPGLQRAKGWLAFEDGHRLVQMTASAASLELAAPGPGRDALQCILVGDAPSDGDLRGRLDACRIEPSAPSPTSSPDPAA